MTNKLVDIHSSDSFISTRLISSVWGAVFSYSLDSHRSKINVAFAVGICTSESVRPVDRFRIDSLGQNLAAMGMQLHAQETEPHKSPTDAESIDHVSSATSGSDAC